MKLRKINPQTYELFENNQSFGTISTYRNLFHDSCIYLKFNLTKIPTTSPFAEIRQHEQKSLQVMIESSQTEIINWISINGFKCKRRCFEAKVSTADLKHPIKSKLKILSFVATGPIYSNCCDFLYKYYKTTHELVSPLTASKNEFITEVPTRTGYYSLDEHGQLSHVAFTENNEIAYLCSVDPTSCSGFIDSLLVKSFEKYQTIFFEADNTDWAASKLLGKFNYKKDESFNTYIYE
ncbi:hypothetical protein GCM10022297_15100 [Lactobacillus hamsteri]|uniref:GNAT family acetyltransferase n=1 Tax=Lactobacillus hamsteri DSM 5661 = JCM 6256 TaxID=1423754 RepID=A0A0R1YJT4_9LACO|nr:hypothetical protein [Lactobacillus hamsteri]KRM40137.1 hypothetical protein FC39_GL000874 [Lactobacillus hamsteri DSM 5661 = JCM 6256]